MYSAVYGTVHYEELLKSFEIRVGHCPGYGLPSVAILPHCAESDVRQYSLTLIMPADSESPPLDTYFYFMQTKCNSVNIQ